MRIRSVILRRPPRGIVGAAARGSAARPFGAQAAGGRRSGRVAPLVLVHPLRMSVT